MIARRKERVADVAVLLAAEIVDRGDAVLILAAVAAACAKVTGSSAPALLANVAGITASDAGLSRNFASDIALNTYDLIASAKSTRVAS